MGYGLPRKSTILDGDSTHSIFVRVWRFLRYKIIEVLYLYHSVEPYMDVQLESTLPYMGHGLESTLPYIVFLAHIYRKSRTKSPFSYVGTILSAHQRFLQNCFIERASIAISCKEEKL